LLLSDLKLNPELLEPHESIGSLVRVFRG